jgi:hypothetical protein
VIPSAFVFFRSSNPASLVVWCGFGFFGGAWLFYRGFRLLQQRRLILDTPFSKIRSAPMGLVEISGLAVGPYNLIAPLTARPCYYYRTLVWELQQRGKNKQWVKVAGDCMYVPFFVDDNTGRMLVDPRGADLDLHRDFAQEFSDSFFTTKEPVPTSVRQFLARHGVATHNRIKVEECCIKPKNALFLLGTLAENPGIEVNAKAIEDHDSSTARFRPGFSLSLNLNVGTRMANPVDAGFDDRLAMLASSQVLRLPSPAAPAKAADMSQQEKVAAALLKAGITSPAAWAAGGIGATGPAAVIVDPSSAAAGNGHGEGNGFEVRPPTVLRKGQNNETFLISWRSQQEIARSLQWKCTLMIWGGPVLALASLSLLLAFFHLL